MYTKEPFNAVMLDTGDYEIGTGEWMEHDNDTGEFAGYQVATVWGGMAEAEGNARLFIAAPDLFEAATALISDVRHRHPNEELHCPFMVALNDAVMKAQARPLNKGTDS